MFRYISIYKLFLAHAWVDTQMTEVWVSQLARSSHVSVLVIVMFCRARESVFQLDQCR